MNIASLKEVVSAEEWQLRVDLAACYRLVALYGWSDLVFTHISARVPGPEHHFLINPYGLMFDEITASSLAITMWRVWSGRPIRWKTRASGARSK